MGTKRVTEPKSIQLLVKFYRRKKVGLNYQLDDPFPKERQPDPAINIIQQALRVKAHLKINPNECAIVTAEKLGMHRKRIPRLMTILANLPIDFQQKLHTCQDNKTHRIFNLKRLYKIALLETEQERLEKIDRLISMTQCAGSPDLAMMKDRQPYIETA